MSLIVPFNHVSVSSQQHSSSFKYVSYIAPTTNNDEACQNIAIPMNIHPIQNWFNSSIVIEYGEFM